MTLTDVVINQMVTDITKISKNKHLQVIKNINTLM